MNTVRKHSHKRDAVLEKLRSTKSHPSAKWIYDELRKDIPDISLGTVYRNLSVFKDEGQIISVGVVNGQERFDANTREHNHFICTGCGSVLDIDTDIEDALSAEVERRYGVEIHSRQLTYYGKCPKCRGRAE